MGEVALNRLRDRRLRIYCHFESRMAFARGSRVVPLRQKSGARRCAKSRRLIAMSQGRNAEMMGIAGVKAAHE